MYINEVALLQTRLVNVGACVLLRSVI